MTTENAEQVNTNAAFLAGFDDEAGSTAEIIQDDKETESATEPKDEALAADTATVDEQAEPAETKTEEPNPLDTRLAAIEATIANIGSIKQGLDKLAGTVGGIGRTINELQSVQRNQPQGSPAAEGARKLELKLEKLSRDYPDIAEALNEDLRSVLSTQSQSIDSSAIQALIDQRVAEQAEQIRSEAKLELQRNRLDIKVPDWEKALGKVDDSGSVVRDAEGRFVPNEQFNAWFSAKPVEFRNEFANTSSADFLATAINQFKNDIAARTESKRTQQQNQSNRLAEAANPQGVVKAGGKSQSTRSAFLQGFEEGPRSA